MRISNSVDAEIDVYINTYNQDDFVDDALNSVINQEFRRLFNIYIYDDKSSSRNLLWDIKNRYKVDVEISRVNEGVSRARNNASEKGVAPWMLFVDGDDKLGEDFLEMLWRRAKITKADVVYPKVAIFTDGPGLAEHGSVLQTHFNKLALFKSNYIPVTSLVRRSVFESVGGFDETMRGGFEDWDLWIRIAINGHSFAFEPRASLLYRHHENARSHAANKKLSEITNYIRSKNSDAFDLAFSPRIEDICTAEL